MEPFSQTNSSKFYKITMILGWKRSTWIMDEEKFEVLFFISISDENPYRGQNPMAIGKFFIHLK